MRPELKHRFRAVKRTGRVPENWNIRQSFQLFTNTKKSRHSSDSSARRGAGVANLAVSQVPRLGTDRCPGVRADRCRVGGVLERRERGTPLIDRGFAVARLSLKAGCGDPDADNDKATRSGGERARAPRHAHRSTA